MDSESLHALYNSDRTARAFFDHLAKRQRNQAETTVDRILKILQRSLENEGIARGDVVSLFKSLQEVEVGQFVTGRWGRPSRFVWDAPLTEVAMAATGEEVPGHEETGEETEHFVHAFNLRSDLTVEFELPMDLTESESQRIAKFITSLPLEEYD